MDSGHFRERNKAIHICDIYCGLNVTINAKCARCSVTQLTQTSAEVPEVSHQEVTLAIPSGLVPKNRKNHTESQKGLG